MLWPGPLVGGRIRQGDGGGIDHLDAVAAPEVLGGHGLFGLGHHVVVDLLQPFHGQLGASLAVGTGFIRGDGSLEQAAEILGLADGLAAGTARLGDLPEEDPEDQPQIPTAIAGMGVLLLLREAMARDKAPEEGLELVEGGAGSGAQACDLSGEAAGPKREVGRVYRQRLYCPIDNHATLFCMKPKSKRSEQCAAYRRLQQRLAQTGWIALGSLVERTEAGKGGPRYQWSRRVGRKTVTVALSAEQFRWLGKAIANQRVLWEILTEMQRLTLTHMWKHLPGPPRHKRLSKKTLGLN